MGAKHPLHPGDITTKLHNMPPSSHKKLFLDIKACQLREYVIKHLLDSTPSTKRKGFSTGSLIGWPCTSIQTLSLDTPNWSWPVALPWLMIKYSLTEDLHLWRAAAAAKRVPLGKISTGLQSCKWFGSPWQGTLLCWEQVTFSFIKFESIMFTVQMFTNVWNNSRTFDYFGDCVNCRRNWQLFFFKQKCYRRNLITMRWQIGRGFPLPCCQKLPMGSPPSIKLSASTRQTSCS